jgi:hypothetical protein
MTLVAEEFIRRFLLHVLPEGLVRIRQYGWMANRCRSQSVEQCRTLLAADPPAPATTDLSRGRRCPVCGGVIEVVEMSCLATYPVAGSAKDVCRIPLSRTLLLAGHAGRGARTGEVRRFVPTCFPIGSSQERKSPNRGVPLTRIRRRAVFLGLGL